MAIRLKIASSAKELDDVFWLRYQVYAELGYFGDTGGSEHLSDRFDAHPYSANIIAYADEHIPIGTLRVNMDSGGGLPADEYYDFTAHRQAINEEWVSLQGEEPHICSAGMLAIRKGWRNRRDVIRALFKMAASVAHSWGVTHVIATVNYQSHTMYKRIGFEILDEKQWIEEIGEFIVPMMIPFEVYYRWAVGDLLEEEEVLLDLFLSQFHRVVLSKGEYLFKEGEEASECYMVDSGTLKITRQDELADRELTLAILKRGGLTGELALIDNEPRSANAIALSNTDLMVLERDEFFSDLTNISGRMQELLSIFSRRIRRMDGLAVVLAYGSARQRLEFALKGFRNTAAEDKKRAHVLLAKAGPADLARSAGVNEDEAREYLDELKNSGACEYSDHWIRFIDRRISASENGNSPH